MTPDEERIAELEAELAALRAKPKKVPAKKRAAKKKAVAKKASTPAKRAPVSARSRRPLRVIPVYREGGPDLKKLAQAIVETLKAQHGLPLDRPPVSDD